MWHLNECSTLIFCSWSLLIRRRRCDDRIANWRRSALINALIVFSVFRMLRLESKLDHVTPIVYELHWLLVRMRIHFKLLPLVYMCLRQMAPEYLRQLVRRKQKSNYDIRSYSIHLLHVPNSRTKAYSDRAFSVRGPIEWNKLPLEMRLVQSLYLFNPNSKLLFLLSIMVRNKV